MPVNNLYLVPLKVRPLSGYEMPEELKGAIAFCFVGAPDHLTAVSKAAESLRENDYEVVDVAADVQQLDHKEWSTYVKSVWPEISGQMPTQEAVSQHVANGEVFYGPFAGWEES